MGSRLEKNSSAVRKRIENYTFSDETGEEYEASAFGGFGDYFRRKKIKLQNLDAELRASAPDKPQIFKGVVAHVMGYTQPSLQVLHKELVQHGAGFLQYLDSKTMATHIIASALPPKKVVDYNKYRMVKPQWVVDSINAGKLLPWTDYRIFDEGPRQKTLKFDGGKMTAEATQYSQLGYREQTQDSFYARQLQKRSGEHPGASSPGAGASTTASASSSVPERSASNNGLENGSGDQEMPDFASLGTRSSEAPQLIPGPLDLARPTSARESCDSCILDDSEPVDEDTSPQEQTAGNAASSRAKSAPLEDAPAGRPGQKPMTSEEHNAMLLKDPKIWKSSTANPDFLRQFYSESRLHHLSTWKAELKSKMQRMAAEKGPTNKHIKRKPGSRRYIMHVDFDSFFCAVSLKSAPEYVDKPAVVAHGTGAGSEIASCNYPAREFGVKNGMWMKRALELCPNLKVMPYDFPAYEEASHLFYEAILDVGGVVQSVSVDEALIDVTSLVLDASASSGVGVDEGSIWREQEKANEMALSLRDDIKRKTGCAVSVGIGPNILMAKVALRKAKPAGQYQVKPEEILDMIGALKVEDLPGVAYSIKGKLEEAGARLVKDVRELSRNKLAAVLGPKTGERLWEYARGIDRAEVGDQPMRKSVSAEVNWGVRFVSQQEAEEFVMNLCKELEKRLLNEGLKGKSFTMKVMRRSADSPLDPPKHLGHGKCDTFNKSVGFGIATSSADFIGKEAVSILRSFNFPPGDLRGLGVHLTRLEPIKGSASGPESSQKTLSFGAFAKTSAPKKPPPEAIEDDRRDPHMLTSSDEVGLRRASSGRDMSSDPITVDPITPRKPRASPMHPALALSRAREADVQAKTPLNVNGTQFIMPSHPDPEVVAALPQDIRSKLMAQQKKSAAATTLREESPAAGARSRTGSPGHRGDEMPSDINAEVFNGLPDDVKAEVLASYRRRGGQTLLPLSPRKDRVIRAPSTKTTPTKRGGGIRGMLSRARERQHDAEAGLLQTNLFPVQRRDAGNLESTEDAPEDLDPEFLAALPEEVRKEVIAGHRRQQMAQRGGLDLHVPQRPRPAVGATAVADSGGSSEDRQTKLQFPARPPPVGFTKQSLTSLPKIKDMLHLWHQDTLDTGPHQHDVAMFETYLTRVVGEEKNMEKAQILVAWLDWLVEEDDGGYRGKQQWRLTMQRIKDAVQKAMAERGFGPMNLG